MALKLVYNISSYHNISFDHDVEVEDLADVIGEDVVADYEAGNISENDLLNRVWEENKDYINDLIHQHVEMDIRIEDSNG